MSKLSHKISPEGVEALRAMTEHSVNRRIVTPADYDYLSAMIRDTVHQQVSATTLKRVWGYVRDTGDTYLPSRYTVCALAKLAGFRDYEEFIDSLNTGPVESMGYQGEYLQCHDLCADERVELRWSPGRRVVLRHLDDDVFEVEESVNARICAGDIVECASMMQHAPLYFNRVRRPGHQPMSYVAGSRTGIIWTLLDR